MLIGFRLQADVTVVSPSRQRLTYRFTNEEDAKSCGATGQRPACPLKANAPRAGAPHQALEHEAVLELLRPLDRRQMQYPTRSTWSIP